MNVCNLTTYFDFIVRSLLNENLILVWKVHLVVSWAMVGLIWTVQLAIYPRFRNAADFVADHRFYTKRIGIVVGPLMLMEMMTGFILLIMGIQSFLFLLMMVLLIFLWISTALIQIPLHRRLNKGFDDSVAALLTRTNWIRTVAWSLRGLGLLFLDLHLFEK